jgi:HlyD family secretion protein
MIRDDSSMDRPVSDSGAKTRKQLIWGAVALLLVALMALFLPSWRRWAESETSIDIARVRMGTVTRGDLVRDVSVEGRVVAAFHPTLFAQTEGIARLRVAAGQVIEQGQVLGHVQSPELQSRARQERSNLLSLQADLDRQRILAEQSRAQYRQSIGLLEVELEAAKRAMDRAERTRQEGLLNAVEYEKAQDDVKVSDLKLEVSRQQADFESKSLDFELQNRGSQVERQRLLVEELERQVAELTIRSPVSGLVSRLLIEDHDAVTPGQGMVTVVDLSALEIEIQVPESFADEIIIGTEAAVTYEGESFLGTVTSISPEVEGSRVRGRVAFDAAPPRGLKQNQRVQAKLLMDTRIDVLKAPRGPFLEAGGGRQAYVIEDGIAVLRPIQVGAVSLAEVEIVSGLDFGEQLIISDTARFEGAKKVLLRR